MVNVGRENNNMSIIELLCRTCNNSISQQISGSNCTTIERKSRKIGKLDKSNRIKRQ
jgi:hypothetical protein